MEIVIKLLLMRLNYAEPEVKISAESSYKQNDQQFLEHQKARTEGKTGKQKRYKVKYS